MTPQEQTCGECYRAIEKAVIPFASEPTIVGCCLVSVLVDCVCAGELSDEQWNRINVEKLNEIVLRAVLSAVKEEAREQLGP